MKEEIYLSVIGCMGLLLAVCLGLLAVNWWQRWQERMRAREGKMAFAFEGEGVAERRRPPPPTPEGYYLWETLSDREKEVARLYGEGRSVAEIAERLTISRNTVKRHLGNIFAKLEIHRQLELVKMVQAIEEYDRQ
ncbi:MAG: LuxR C-terminal-related transcriptional regulator [Anaerolineae bacterium]